MRRNASGVLRIIGGQWRSRLIAFDPISGARATPDRVRQTLFDWLAPVIAGARCLDLYAGSGALGFEALSRGARSVTFVDHDAAQVSFIERTVASLGAGAAARVVHADAQQILRSMPLAPEAPRADRYDIVFLDPPFASDELTAALVGLAPLLASTHRVYVEWPRWRTASLPDGYAWLRRKQAGQVSYGLVTCVAGPGEAG